MARNEPKNEAAQEASWSELHQFPWIDSLNRFESQHENMMDEINSIGRKVEYVTTIVDLLLGGLIGILAFSPESTQNIRLTFPLNLAAGLGLGGIVIAFLLANHAYLSRRLVGGVGPGAPRDIAGERVGSEEYVKKMLLAYSTMMERNHRYIQRLSTQFAMALVALIGGFMFLTFFILASSGILPTEIHEIAFLIAVAIIEVAILQFIHTIKNGGIGTIER